MDSVLHLLNNFWRVKCILVYKQNCKKKSKNLKIFKKKYGIDTHVMLSLIKGINDIKNKNDYN